LRAHLVLCSSPLSVQASRNYSLDVGVSGYLSRVSPPGDTPSNAEQSSIQRAEESSSVMLSSPSRLTVQIDDASYARREEGASLGGALRLARRDGSAGSSGSTPAAARERAATKRRAVRFTASRTTAENSAEHAKSGRGRKSSGKRPSTGGRNQSTWSPLKKLSTRRKSGAAFEISISASALHDALFKDEPIEWCRLGSFQDVTMRLIAERFLSAHARTLSGRLSFEGRTYVSPRLPRTTSPPLHSSTSSPLIYLLSSPLPPLLSSPLIYRVASHCTSPLLTSPRLTSPHLTGMSTTRSPSHRKRASPPSHRRAASTTSTPPRTTPRRSPSPPSSSNLAGGRSRSTKSTPRRSSQCVGSLRSSRAASPSSWSASASSVRVRPRASTSTSRRRPWRTRPVCAPRPVGPPPPVPAVSMQWLQPIYGSGSNPHMCGSNPYQWLPTHICVVPTRICVVPTHIWQWLPEPGHT
jgi:hypothetical protein